MQPDDVVTSVRVDLGSNSRTWEPAERGRRTLAGHGIVTLLLVGIGIATGYAGSPGSRDAARQRAQFELDIQALRSDSPEPAQLAAVQRLQSSILAALDTLKAESESDNAATSSAARQALKRIRSK